MPRSLSELDATTASFLDGQLLVAMPGIGDPRFERTVIYVCAHSADGAMGLVVNKPADGITFGELLERLDIVSEGQPIRIDDDVATRHVQFGGPVETGRGFVLHSTDYFAAEATLPIDEGVGLTATLDVLRAIVNGRGPKKSIMALGYAGWGPGQLETEIQRNGWITVPADDEILFDPDLDTKYDRAMRKIGIDLTKLSAQAGHA
ncbi:MAG: YqgE/AlgH family protein [Hyphomicrobiales bacterium]